MKRVRTSPYEQVTISIHHKTVHTRRSSTLSGFEKGSNSTKTSIQNAKRTLRTRLLRDPKPRYCTAKAFTPAPARKRTILDMPSSEFFNSLDRLRFTLSSLQGSAFWDALVAGLSNLLDVEYCFAVQNLRVSNPSAAFPSPSHSPVTHSPSAAPDLALEPAEPSDQSMYSHRFYSFWSATNARHSHHNFEFDAACTPCSEVSRNFNRILLVSSGLVEQFPDSPFWESLRDLLPNSELAVPVLDIDGTYLGHVAIMLTKEDGRRHGGNLDWAMMEMTVRVLAERASAEMRRQKLEEETRRLCEYNLLRQKSRNEAVLSHEIRTPLQGVIGLIELLFPQTSSNIPVPAPSPAPTDDQADLIASLRLSSTALLRLLDTMTDDEDGENGQLRVLRRWCDIRNIVGDVTSTLGGVRKEVGEQEPVEVRWRVDEEVPEKCFVDALRLKQVLSILMNNALKFTFSGSVTLTATLMTAEEARKVIDNTISLTSENSQSRYVKFTIEDTGIGIPLAKRQLLFKPSSQGNVTHTRSDESKTFGLALARNIARFMGGTVWLERSVVGEGSTFSMCTIVTDKNTSQQEKAKVEVPEASASTNPLPVSALTPTKPALFPSYDANLARAYPLRIMVVEDNAVTRQLAIKMLAKLGYQDVIGCCHGQEAVERFQREWEEENVGRDLMLMDCWMPVMDGFESTRRILDYVNTLSTSASTDPQDDQIAIPRKRKRLATPVNPPVIVAITADNSVKNKENVIKAGMTAMVVKPFIIAELQNMIVTLFGSCSTSNA